jgi:lysophospholipase L1-like esterase
MAIKIVTIGDSLTEGSAHQAQLCKSPRLPYTYQSTLYEELEAAGYDVLIINEGIGGQIASQIADRLDKVVPAEYLIITAGTNDCWRFSDAVPDDPDFVEEMASETFAFIKESVEKIQDQVLKKIVIVSVPPVRNTPDRYLPKNMLKATKRLNEKYKAYCSEQGFAYCDLFPTMTDSEGFLRDDLHKGDGVHFSLEGNREFGLAVAACMKKLLA